MTYTELGYVLLSSRISLANNLVSGHHGYYNSVLVDVKNAEMLFKVKVCYISNVLTLEDTQISFV